VNDDVLVQVPIGDATRLEDLAAALKESQAPVVVHPFDGETVAQIVVALGATSLAALRAWLHHQVAQRKTFKVVRGGLELTGYTHKEVDVIVHRLQESMPQGSRGDE